MREIEVKLAKKHWIVLEIVIQALEFGQRRHECLGHKLATVDTKAPVLIWHLCVKVGVNINRHNARSLPACFAAAINLFSVS